MNHHEKEAWRDSHQCCEYIADALGYDSDKWDDPEDPEAVWTEAAKAAAADGMGDGHELCWGVEYRTVDEII